MGRKWKGILAIEGVQTGDGRVIAEGALEWPDPPLPLAWLQASMHGMGGEGGVSVGNIDTIARGETPAEIHATGVLDDGHDDGAEVVRQLTEGTAPLGNRWGLSIDPDDWVVEYVDTAPDQISDDDGEAIAAAGGLVVQTVTGRGPKALGMAMVGFAAMVAAAGDPDPDEGVVVHQEDVGRFIARFTHLRIRGVTMVQTEAIVGAYLELDGEASDEPAEPREEEPVAAAATARPAPARVYFEEPEPASGDERLIPQPSGGFSVPLTISEPDEHGWRQVTGHLANWEQCHIAFKDRCRGCPPSPSGYANFRLHTTSTDAGDVVTGPLLMGCDHASTDVVARLSLEQARDHYANSGLAWADVTITDGTFGPWISGVVKEEVDEVTLRRIKACGWSGDWRPTPKGLDLVAIQSVPTPGFPQLRLVAGGAPEWGTEVAYDEDGEVTALIVASAPPAHGCGCGGVTAGVDLVGITDPDRLMRIEATLATLERRTRHLTRVEAAELVASLTD